MIEITTKYGDLQIVSPTVIIYSDDVAQETMEPFIDEVINDQRGYWPDFYMHLASKVIKKFGGRIVGTDQKVQVINPEVDY